MPENQTTELAVVIMAYDEAEVLPRALASLAPLGEAVEVFVSVDDKTRDATAQVALELLDEDHVLVHAGIPLQPIQEPEGTRSVHSLNSMSRMRNDVFDLVCQRTDAPYLMWLDADEWLSEGHDQLLAAVAAQREAAKPVDGMLVRMEDVQEDLVTTWRAWSNVKVVHRDQRFARRRHEGCFDVKTKLVLPVLLLHCKTPSEEHQELRLQQKLNEVAFLQDWREFRDIRAAYYLGDCLLSRGALDHAELWFQRALDIPDQGLTQRSLAAMKLCAVRFRMGNLAGAREAAWAMLQADWQRGDAFFDLAMLAGASGSIEEAKFWLRCATLSGPARSVQEMPTEKVEDLPLLKLAQIAADEGQFDQAFDYAEQARAFGRNRPEFHELRVRLQDVMAPEPWVRSREGLVLVSGGMRVGSTWLADVLNRLGRFVNEPFLLTERGWHHRDNSAAEGGPQCSPEFMQACAERLPYLRPQRGGFTEEERTALVDLYRRFPEEWPEAVGYKDALPQISAAAFPDAQLVYLVREPVSVVASISKRFGSGPDVSQMREACPDVWDYCRPDGYDQADELVRKRMDQMLYATLLPWLDLEELREEGFSVEAGNVCVVEFEDLTANYHHVFPDLLDWLGYDPVPAYEQIRPRLTAPPDRPPEDLEERRLLVLLAEQVAEKARQIVEV